MHAFLVRSFSFAAATIPASACHPNDRGQETPCLRHSKAFCICCCLHCCHACHPVYETHTRTKILCITDRLAESTFYYHTAPPSFDIPAISFNYCICVPCPNHLDQLWDSLHTPTDRPRQCRDYSYLPWLTVINDFLNWQAREREEVKISSPTNQDTPNFCLFLSPLPCQGHLPVTFSSGWWLILRKEEASFIWDLPLWTPFWAEGKAQCVWHNIYYTATCTHTHT